ncbi:tetratricopeptide repeat protein [Halopseudomonas sp.]|uniref:tetratricopeptide repeat protein n=1 Tax=Halopseudomonas sp. TaxID=2901191 RepID=UPI00311F87CD
MRYSPAAESVPLFRPWALVLAAILVVTVLAMSYQNRDAFFPSKGDGDQVSASYAELLLAAEPDNVALRAELVEMLIQLGEFDRAGALLDSWQGGSQADRQFYGLLLNVNAAIVSEDPARITAAQALMAVFDVEALSSDQQRELAELALQIDLPALAADMYFRLAESERQERLTLLASSARWYLAAGDQRSAAKVYQQLAAEAQSASLRSQYAISAYDAMAASGNVEQATAYLLAQAEHVDLSAWPAQRWSDSVAIAEGAMRHDLARQLNDLWLQAIPDSPDGLQMRFRLQLAAGETEDAWKTGHRLLALQPNSAPLIKQMAQLAQWTNRPEIALDFWVAYLALVPDDAVRELAWRQAFALFNYDRGIALLNDTAASRSLTAEELEALVYAHEARGTAQQAERWLRSYVARVPSHRLAWSKLLQNLQNTQQPDAEVETWQAFATHHALTLDERRRWAEVLWDTYQPELAWKVIDVPTQGMADADFWRLRAALAWELGRDDELLASYQAMQRSGQELRFEEETQLIAMYRQSQPRRSLALLIASWQRTGDTLRLLDAVQLAQDLDDWHQLEVLLAEAGPELNERLALVLARGSLAEHHGRSREAERLYLHALKGNPNNVLLRERLLWLYVERQDQVQLAHWLERWEPGARAVPALWLVMGAANQVLGRSRALQWYERHLRNQPNDQLALAAWADALDEAGRNSDALRVRSALFKQLRQTAAVGGADVRSLWLRLTAASVSGERSLQQALLWRDGSASSLQLWFSAQLAHLDRTNQQAQKDAWLAWGRERSLSASRYDLIQAAMSSVDGQRLAALYDEQALDPAQQVEVLSLLGNPGRAQTQARAALGDQQRRAVQQQLWRQSIQLAEAHPQGARIQFGRNDYGGLRFVGPELSVGRFVNEHWYAHADIGQGRYDSALLDQSAMGAERNLSLELQRQLPDGSLSLLFDGSRRSDEGRYGVGLTRRWSLGDDALAAGLDWQRKTEETGLMRALGQQDGAWLQVSHSLSARDQLSWSLAQRRYSTRSGKTLASGQLATVEFSQIQFFEGPTWALRTGLDWQRYSLRNPVLDELLAVNGGVVNQPALQVDQLLPEKVGRFYVGSEWRRGFPGALNRTRGQYTWLLDTSTGWDWEEQSFTYAINAGVGVEVLGDDELSLRAGYQSAPVGGDGESGGNVNISYSVRFGR